MEPKVLICYLEKNKFTEHFFQSQMECLKQISTYFDEVLYLQEENIGKLFLEIDVKKSICLTTSPVVAEQMQGLGISVIGFEADSQEMMKAPYVVLGLDELTYRDFVRVYRRWHKLPWDILQTDRLYVREFSMEDMEALRRLYEQPHMTDYVEPLFEDAQERQYQKNYIEKIYGFYGFGMWLVFHKETGELIGRAGVEFRETCRDGEVEMGYLISPEYQRKGYGTEVCKAIMGYAKEELQMERILCRVSPENKPSIAFLKQLGFELSKQEDEWFFSYEL